MNRFFGLLTSLALLASGAVTFPLNSQSKLSADNIDAVLGAMSLEEKAAIVVGYGWGDKLGYGVDDCWGTVAGLAGVTQAIPRLGIPFTVFADGPAGLRIKPVRDGSGRTYYCTCFPSGNLLSSTWNSEAVTSVATAMGDEVKEYGVDVLLAPGMNIHRNPLNGRNFEYYSEDPVLSGRTGAAFVRGIQSNGVGVSMKHFVCNNQETNRLANETVVNPRALREIYLKGFEICVREAQPWTIMASYNKLNGTFTQENRDLLTTILREEWGFKGLVMTDWIGQRNTVAQIHAGNDLMEPGEAAQTQELLDAVKTGSLSIDDLNTSARRILEFVVKTRRFNGYKYSDKPDLKAHAAVVRKEAPEGMVLLKNSADALPFKNVSKVALYGVTSYDFISGGTGAAFVHVPYIVNIEDGLKNAGLVPDSGISEFYSKYMAFEDLRYTYSGERPAVHLGKATLPEMDVPFKFIKENASDNDIAVITIGRNAGEGADRHVDNDFNLSDVETRLVRNVCDAFHSVGKKVIVILNVGGVVETASWKSLPDGILLVWQPGLEGGNAIADVVTGKAYPSGKLPMTFPVSYPDHPSSANFPYDYVGIASVNQPAIVNKTKVRNIDYTEYKEGIWVGYRFFDTVGKEVSYPFGFGLSYTTFDYSKPVVRIAKDGTVTASVVVTNSGLCEGKEIVELYVSAPAGGLVKPAKELKAYAKTSSLAPGESQTVTMAIDPYSLASFNERISAWETASGEYTVSFGSSVEDIRAKGSFKVSKASSRQAHDVMHPQSPLEEMSIAGR